jgi:hypothetical protein
METMRKVYVLAFVLVVSCKLYSQYSYTIPYTQNFNGLGIANSTVAGGDLNLVNVALNG